MTELEKLKIANHDLMVLREQLHAKARQVEQQIHANLAKIATMTAALEAEDKKQREKLMAKKKVSKKSA